MQSEGMATKRESSLKWLCLTLKCRGWITKKNITMSFSETQSSQGNRMFMFSNVSAAGGSPGKEYKAAISPEAHVKHTVCGRTAPPADLLESCHFLVQKTAGWHGDGESSITGRKRPDAMIAVNGIVTSLVGARTAPVDANQTEMLRRSTPPAQGSALSQQTHNLLQYTYRRASPPSLLSHNTQNRARTKAHIRRAGGSTLSGVRNNSFWPSPACVLKWSPWVAAYQRATAIEWVVGITQPGFRTYTGHSKGQAHWVREIHAEADCARSCFDWD